MHRDTEQALKRLEQALLEEEQTQPEASPLQEEQAPDQADFDDFLESPEGEDPVVYRNFSNDYGRSLRNYATGYKAYNSDTADVDMDAFSEQVREDRPKERLLFPVLVAALALLAVAYIAYLWLGGFL